jgi:hypothetical protein
VPIVYKLMVEQLSSAPSQEGMPVGADAALRHLLGLLLRASPDAGAGSTGGAERGWLNVFWAVFYPWPAAYLCLQFLRGGSGAEGLLSSMRDLLWIPITQVGRRRSRGAAGRAGAGG